MTKLRKFVAPELIFGEGAFDLVGRYATNYGANKVLVVTDPGLLKTPWVSRAIDLLEGEGIDSVVFSEVSPNPRDFQVTMGAEQYHAAKCDIIVAIGGGSAMDCAKGIGILATNYGDILSYEGVDNVHFPCPPLICLPTTAGTSADVSQFAIINNTKENVKIAIISKTMVPDVALIDPCTTMTMEGDLTANTGLDTLVHAIEAYVSTGSSAVTDVHALEAIKLVAEYLPQAVEEPDTYAWREKIMLASLHAGLAFSNASLGAVHAMAHSLGGSKDLPHGECNALLLEHVLAYNYPAAVGRLEQVAEIFMAGIGCPYQPGAGQLGAAVRDFREKLGVSGGLAQRGVCSADIPALAQMAMRDPCMATNPRLPRLQEIEEIYEKAL